MHKKSIIAVLTLIIIASLISACSFFEEEPEPEPVITSSVQQPRVVSAEAFVVPVKKANLALEAGGSIVALEVEEGNAVEEGDLLLQLDNSTELAQLAEIEANKAQAEANLSQSEARLAEAAAGVAEAEASLSKTKAGATPEEIAQLEANLARTEAALAEVLAGPTEEDIAQAEAAVFTAQAQLNEILADAREEDLQAAGSRLLTTQADVREAQSEYDKVRYGDPEFVLKAGVVLEKATLAYESAQADYDKLVNGATPEQVATLRARVGEANAALEKAKAGSTPEQIGQAQAQVAGAQAELDKALAGATDEDIAIAEARVETSQAGVGSARAGVDAASAGVDAVASQVDSVQVQIDKKQLLAPFSGTVGQLNVEEGEIVQAGAPIATLGDLSQWQIETDDLTEIDVVDVQPGAKVIISVDALPGEDFEGKVVRVTPQSETKAGDVTYTVLIDITSGNTGRLKWGMTTFVDIEADSGIPR